MKLGSRVSASHFRILFKWMENGLLIDLDYVSFLVFQFTLLRFLNRIYLLIVYLTTLQITQIIYKTNVLITKEEIKLTH
jgi:hypothetical protein